MVFLRCHIIVKINKLILILLLIMRTDMYYLIHQLVLILLLIIGMLPQVNGKSLLLLVKYLLLIRLKDNLAMTCKYLMILYCLKFMLGRIRLAASGINPRRISIIGPTLLLFHPNSEN